MAPKKFKTALTVALVADFIQIAVFPLFGWGAIVPLNAAYDVILCLALTRLIGWHIAFLPCFLLELTPIVTLVPSWTLAVIIAGRSLRAPVAGNDVEPTLATRGPVIDV
ncbi:MAG TPA: hypothetical protein VEH27_13180 [Methylomirabilota bacterium]|nr:hypothetical protein [Methylomirabilota bacterium]